MWRPVVSEVKGEVEMLVRQAHEEIIKGLMELNLDQLNQGLEWSRSHYSKLDIQQLLEMAIELHEGVSH